MKRFIVIRHGNYDQGSGRLSESGREQLVRLATLLRPHVIGTVRLLSSTAPRAIDSSEVLSKELGIDRYETFAALWSDDDHRQDTDAAIKLIREKSDGVDTLLVVTHLEYAEDLPYYFGKEILGAKIDRKGLNKGWAHVVLCDEKASQLIC